MKVVRNSDRKLNARQDATRARNDVGEIKTFFKKYGSYEINQPEIITLTKLLTLINNVESRALNPQTTHA